MKFYLNFLIGLLFGISTISCSPAHVLFVKNNTDQEKEIFVELNGNKLPKSILLCKELVNDENLEHKVFPKYYKEGKCFHKPINRIDDKIYKINLPAKYTVNIAPNNSIYPFQKISYSADGKKCLISNLESKDCEQKLSQQPKLVFITEILK
ncbi:MULTISPECIES: hypothetical protein [Chryseobacterium]|uniref:hypothetical protein n=1 Tax=Chryseobacterium TaxID=59732 RepID=UPI00195EC671|nr:MULTISPECIES: hypothetical protein [Chryseobacterium]MBM7420969.1 hypothetical protein [Chryseobacterium sp. JUb44]MDH6210927.1 hypothetical protein [Chryseobacterium sp. BIGb0186]WSO09594.1 hypothetical protein VUJ64_17390 [Chryseobacterium scophthalmum]